MIAPSPGACALLLALSASAVTAQPLAALAPPAQAPPPGVRSGAGPPHPPVSPVYRGVMATLVGGIGSTLGAAAPAVVYGLYAIGTAPGLGGARADSDVPSELGVVMAVGATAGTAAFVYVFSGDASDYRGLIPYPDLRKSDWQPALVGAIAALLPGLGAAYLVRQALPADADPFLSYLAVPVAQGLGAAVAIQISR